MTRIWSVSWNVYSRITFWCIHKSTNFSCGCCCYKDHADYCVALFHRWRLVRENNWIEPHLVNYDWIAFIDSNSPSGWLWSYMLFSVLLLRRSTLYYYCAFVTEASTVAVDASMMRRCIRSLRMLRQLSQIFFRLLRRRRRISCVAIVVATVAHTFQLISDCCCGWHIIDILPTQRIAIVGVVEWHELAGHGCRLLQRGFNVGFNLVWRFQHQIQSVSLTLFVQRFVFCLGRSQTSLQFAAFYLQLSELLLADQWLSAHSPPDCSNMSDESSQSGVRVDGLRWVIIDQKQFHDLALSTTGATTRALFRRSVLQPNAEATTVENMSARNRAHFFVGFDADCVGARGANGTIYTHCAGGRTIWLWCWLCCIENGYGRTSMIIRTCVRSNGLSLYTIRRFYGATYHCTCWSNEFRKKIDHANKRNIWSARFVKGTSSEKTGRSQAIKATPLMHNYIHMFRRKFEESTYAKASKYLRFDSLLAFLILCTLTVPKPQCDAICKSGNETKTS